MAKQLNLDIKKFLGLWYDDAGDTNIPVGALSQLQNFQVLPGYKLRKRSGYTPFPTNKNIEITIPAGRMPGDANGDGLFTSDDLDILDSYDTQTLGEGPSLELLACDIVSDGQITSTDSIKLTALISNPYAGDATTMRDLLGVWGTKYDLGVSTTDWAYYTDITVPGIVAGSEALIAIDGVNNIDLCATAQCGNGYVRVFSKLLPITSRDAVITVSEYTPIRGQWYGKLGDTHYHLFARNGHVYKNNNDGTITDLGTLTDNKTEFFQFLDTKNIHQHRASLGCEMGHASNTCLRLGQIFTPTRDSVVTSIVVKMARVNNPSDNIVAKLYTVEDGVPKTLISASTNYVGGNSVIESSSRAITIYTNCVFYFNSVNLSANTNYAFVIERTGPVNTTNHYYVLTGNDTYPGGSLVHYNGTVWEATPSSELWFEINFKYEYSIYIMNGYEYKKFDGVTLSNVEGYVPIVMTGTLPSGAGTSYEPINSLTGKKRQRFNGDPNSSVYHLAEQSLDSINRIEVNGVALTSGIVVDLRAGTVTFTSNVPGEGIDNVEIEWKKGGGSRTDIINKTNYALYGGKNDSRVFLYGDGNELRYSDIANLIQSAEYFPVTNYITCGSKDSNVNNLSKQYDRLIINTETESLWASYDFDSSLGASIAVYPLNDSVGCTVKGCGQIIENNPYIIFNNQVYQIVASNVRDERNVQYMSERVQTLLNELDLSNALTLDYEKYGEYWIVIDNKAYIYNYRLDVWYYYYFADNVTSLLVVDNEVVLGTDNGQLLKMDGSLDDNGVLINAFAETGWLNYGYSSLLKFLNFMWVQIFPEMDTSAEVYYQIDRSEPRLIKEIWYKNIDFEDIDFEDFTFLTNYNPKSFRLKPKAKKFVYIKFTIINEKKNKLTLLGIDAPALLGGQSK